MFQTFMLPEETQEAVSLVCVRRGWKIAPYGEGAAYDIVLVPPGNYSEGQTIRVKFAETFGNVLEETVIGWKSRDVETDSTATNSMFQAVRRACRKNIVDHCVGWVQDAPSERWPYPDVKCSEGAYRFCANGGVLAQNHTLTLRFAPSTLEDVCNTILD